MSQHRNGDAMAEKYGRRWNAKEPRAEVAQSSTRKPRLPRLWLILALLSAFAGGVLVGQQKAPQITQQAGKTMANYVAVGAGDNSYNGVYAPNGATSNNNPVYQLGTGAASRYIFNIAGANAWFFNTSVNTTNSVYSKQYGITGTYSMQPNGIAPAPTVTLQSSAASIPDLMPFF